MKLEDIFRIEKREVIGKNPISKEDIKFSRNYYIFEGIEFYQSEKTLKRLQSLKLTDEEYNDLKSSLKEFVAVLKEDMIEEFNEDEEYQILDKALTMEDSEALRLYLLSTSADLIFTYLDSSYSIEKVREMTSNEVDVRIFKALVEDDVYDYKRLIEVLTEEEDG